MAIQNGITAKLLLVGFVALFLIFFMRNSGSKAPKVGELAPDFTLKTEAGKPVSLSDYRGKIVVVNFWASWCVPCVDELPSLNQFAERYASKGVEVLGVSLDEDAVAYKKFLTKYQVGFTTVRNINRAISEKYGTFQIPESYVISPDGHLLRKIIGGADWTTPQMYSYFDGLLREASNGTISENTSGS